MGAFVCYTSAPVDDKLRHKPVGLHPRKACEVMPSTTSENALFAEYNVAVFIADAHTKKEKLIHLPGFIEF